MYLITVSGRVVFDITDRVRVKTGMQEASRVRFATSGLVENKYKLQTGTVKQQLLLARIVLRAGRQACLI